MSVEERVTFVTLEEVKERVRGGGVFEWEEEDGMFCVLDW